MFLANMMNKHNLKKANEAGRAAERAAAKAWFTQYQSDPDNAPPAPWEQDANPATNNADTKA